MPTTSEMYERGAADAERGEFNPFYYQHYYYYRQGYDSVRRRGRPRIRPVVTMTVVVLIVSATALAVWNLYQAGLIAQPVSPSVALAESVTATPLPPTPTPLPPTPTPLPPTPTPTPPALQAGGRAVVVNVGNSALRLRAAPGLQARVVATIPAGREVVLLEGPVVADGYTWWQVEAGRQRGWCAVAAASGDIFLQPVP